MKRQVIHTWHDQCRHTTRCRNNGMQENGYSPGIPVMPGYESRPAFIYRYSGDLTCMNPFAVHRYSLLILLLSAFLLLVPFCAADTADTSGAGQSWRVLPIRNSEEFDLGLVGGEAVLFFEQLDWIAANEPVAAFDPNRNSRADFNDIVRIYDEL